MENELNANPAGTESGSTIDMEAKGFNDIMVRRLKNRERQRRYRARKRLEADIKKSHAQNPSPIQQVELQLNGSLIRDSTRVYCQRDWKKDARRAHLYKSQEARHNVPSLPAQTSAESQTLSFVTETTTEGAPGKSFNSENSHILACSETGKTKLRPRDWKAEARNRRAEVDTVKAFH